MAKSKSQMAGEYVGDGLKKIFLNAPTTGSWINRNPRKVILGSALGAFGVAEGIKYFTPGPKDRIAPPTDQQLIDHILRSDLSPQQKNRRIAKIQKGQHNQPPEAQWYQPFVNGWNTTIDWIKKNPGWATAIGAGAVGVPLLAWLMSRNKDQQEQQEYEDQNSYKYKYGRR